MYYQSVIDFCPANLKLSTSTDAAGPALALAGYAASLLPPIYAQTNFWTSSPTFFFLRVGVLVSLLPIAFAWNAAFRGRSPIREFGLASLFVYWIHVELVYGYATALIHHRLSLGANAVAYILMCVVAYWSLDLRDRVVQWWRFRRPD